MNDDTGGRRRLRRRWSLRTGLLAIGAGAALLTAACSGGSASSPSVASLGSSSGTGSGSPASSGDGSGDPTTTGLTGNPAQLLDEWVACMRSHGDPSQADPTIDANKVIHIVMLPSVPGGVSGSNGQSSSGPGMYCQSYLNAASTALRGGQPPQKAPSQAELVKYAACMRANGVPDFPDPGAQGLVLPQNGTPGSDLNPDNPVFQNASKVCEKKTGVYPAGGGGPLPPGSILSGPPGGGSAPLVPVSGGNGGPGANG
jgi:hypothetical protein